MAASRLSCGPLEDMFATLLLQRGGAERFKQPIHRPHYSVVAAPAGMCKTPIVQKRKGKMNLVVLLPLLIQLVPTIQNILTGTSSNQVINASIKEQTPQDVVSALAQIGAQLFPKVSPGLQIVAAALAVYSNPSDIKKLQTSLNKLTKPSPNLQVDGVYGPNTRDAVEALQKQLGLKVDGVAGEATQAAIAAELAKLPQ
jgi:murein L,D-transpeptidase YcbB/YkuD